MSSENALTDMFILMAKQYWWIFLILIFAPLLKMFMPVIKGRIGEGVVNLAAKLRLDSNIYHVIKDVTIPSKNGTTQIDHVIVSKFGVFVIETKNWSGWIWGKENDRTWTQKTHGKTSAPQNPLRQNDGHVCALSDLLDLPKDKIHGVVCFMGDAEFKNGVPEGVFLEGHCINHIESFRNEVFTTEEVSALTHEIESGRLKRGFKTDRQHVQQLKSRRSEIRGQKSAGAGDAASSLKNDFVGHDSVEKTCPKCGAEMVLRTAKRGANAGNQFWGCSNYPPCRETLPV